MHNSGRTRQLHPPGAAEPVAGKVRQNLNPMVSCHGMDPTSLLPAIGAILLALATAALLPHIIQLPIASPPRYSTIDGLRGYLAFAVFLSHSSIWYFYLHFGRWDVPQSNFYTHLGQSSVTLFFMITGFLFWSKLLDGRVQPIDWSRLYLSRLFRLVPLYLCRLPAWYLSHCTLPDFSCANRSPPFGCYTRNGLHLRFPVLLPSMVSPIRFLLARPVVITVRMAILCVPSNRCILSCVRGRRFHG